MTKRNCNTIGCSNTIHLNDKKTVCLACFTNETERPIDIVLTVIDPVFLDGCFVSAEVERHNDRDTNDPRLFANVITDWEFNADGTAIVWS